MKAKSSSAKTQPKPAKSIAKTLPQKPPITKPVAKPVKASDRKVKPKAEVKQESIEEIENEQPQVLSLKQTSCLTIIEPAFIPYLIEQSQPSAIKMQSHPLDDTNLFDPTGFFPPGEIFVPASIQGLSAEVTSLAYISRHNILFVSGKYLIQQSTNVKDKRRSMKFVYSSQYPITHFRFMGESNLLILMEKPSGSDPILRVFSFFPFVELISVAIESVESVKSIDCMCTIENRFSPLIVIAGIDRNQQNVIALYSFDFAAKTLAFMCKTIVNFYIVKCEFATPDNASECILLGESQLTSLMIFEQNGSPAIFVEPYAFSYAQVHYHFVDFEVIFHRPKRQDRLSSKVINFIYVLSASGHILVFDSLSKALKLTATIKQGAVAQNASKKSSKLNTQAHNYSLATAINKTISPIVGDECVLVCDNSGHIQYLSLDLNDEIVTYSIDCGIVSCVAGSSGELLLSTLDDSLVTLNPIDGSSLIVNSNHSDQILGCCYNRLTGKALTIGGDGKVMVWTMEENLLHLEHQYRCKESNPICCESQSIGEMVLVGFENGLIRFFDLKQLKFTDKFKASDLSVAQVRSSINDKYYGFVDSALNVGVFDDSLNSLATIPSLYETGSLRPDSFQLQFDSNVQLLLYSLSSSSVGVFSLAKKTNIAKIICEGPIMNSLFAFSGKCIYVADTKARVQIFKQLDSSGKYSLVKEIVSLSESRPLKMALSLNYKYLFMLDQSGCLKVWNSQFRGKAIADQRCFESSKEFDDFVICDDFCGKILLVSKDKRKLLCLDFKGNLDIDDQLEDLNCNQMVAQSQVIQDQIDLPPHLQEIFDSKTELDDQTPIKANRNDQKNAGLTAKDPMTVSRGQKMDTQGSNLIDSEYQISTKDHMLNAAPSISSESSLKIEKELVFGLSSNEGSQSVAFHMESKTLGFLFQDQVVFFRPYGSKKIQVVPYPIQVRRINHVSFSNTKSFVVAGNTSSDIDPLSLVIYEAWSFKTPVCMLNFERNFDRLANIFWSQNDELLAVIGIKGSLSVLQIYRYKQDTFEDVTEAELEDIVVEGLFLPIRSYKTSADELILVSNNNVYFFKLTGSEDLLYQKIDFAQYRYFQIDFNFSCISWLEVAGQVLALVGSNYGSLLLIETRSASVIGSFNFIVGTERIKAIFPIQSENDPSTIRLVFALDSANVLVLGPLPCTEIEKFTYSLSVVSKQSISLDGKLSAIAFEGRNNPKCVMLTENNNIFFANIEHAQKIKLRSWHAKAMRKMHNVITSTGSHLVTIGADDSIKFWSPEKLEEAFEFLTPGRNCYSSDVRTVDGMMIAGFSDGCIRIYFEEEFLGNACIENNSPVVFVAFIRSFKDCLLAATNKSVYLVKIEEDFSVNIKKAFDSKNNIVGGSISVTTPDELFSLVLESGEVQIWHLTDILDNIQLPGPLRKNNKVTLQSLATHLLDSFHPFTNLKNQTLIAAACFSEFESDVMMVAHPLSKTIYFRNYRQGLKSRTIEVTSGVSSIAHLKSYMGIAIGMVSGEISFLNHFSKTIIGTCKISQQPIRAITENMTEDGNNGLMGLGSKKLSANLWVLTDSGILKIKASE